VGGARRVSARACFRVWRVSGLRCGAALLAALATRHTPARVPRLPHRREQGARTARTLPCRHASHSSSAAATRAAPRARQHHAQARTCCPRARWRRLTAGWSQTQTRRASRCRRPPGTSRPHSRTARRPRRCAATGCPVGALACRRGVRGCGRGALCCGVRSNGATGVSGGLCGDGMPRPTSSHRAAAVVQHARHATRTHTTRTSGCCCRVAAAAAVAIGVAMLQPRAHAPTRHTTRHAPPTALPQAHSTTTPLLAAQHTLHTRGERRAACAASATPYTAAAQLRTQRAPSPAPSPSSRRCS
jgi:hypothetical protein